MNAYIRNKESFQINNLSLLLQKLEREEQNKPNARQSNKIIKIRAEINHKSQTETIGKNQWKLKVISLKRSIKLINF